MYAPLPLRGFLAVVDRALDPRAATRNAGRAASDLSAQLRQWKQIDESLTARHAETQVAQQRS